MRITYALADYGKEEIAAVNEVLHGALKNGSHWIVPGKRVKEFESKIATIFGMKFGAMVNSGSSANMLALRSLGEPGMEVLTPVVTFATTVAPILQLGMKPVFFDVDIGTYQIDVNALEKWLSKAPKKRRILMVPALFGNIPDLTRLRALSREYDMPFILDSCDTLGATWKGRPIGTYADVATSSFYGSHVITTAGAGGIIMTSNRKLAEKFMVLRGWGRTSALFGESEDLNKRFNTKIDGIPYDAKFIFIELGYNMQASEIQAAFGMVQLKKLPRFTKRRIENFSKLLNYFSRVPYFELPVQSRDATTNWMNFPLTLKEGCPFTRKELATFLEKHGIQTRPLFTGNILRQPAFKNASRQKAEDFQNAEVIMHRSLVIGCHQSIDEKQLQYIYKTFDAFLTQYA